MAVYVLPSAPQSTETRTTVGARLGACRHVSAHCRVGSEHGPPISTIVGADSGGDQLSQAITIDPTRTYGTMLLSPTGNASYLEADFFDGGGR